MSDIADILSIVGFIISLITMVQAFRISTKLKKQKYEIRFRSLGHMLNSSFRTFLDQMINKEINLILLTDIKNKAQLLLHFAENCNWEKGKNSHINELLICINEFIELFNEKKDYEEVYTQTLLKLTEVCSDLNEEVQML